MLPEGGAGSSLEKRTSKCESRWRFLGLTLLADVAAQSRSAEHRRDDPAAGTPNAEGQPEAMESLNSLAKQRSCIYNVELVNKGGDDG